VFEDAGERAGFSAGRVGDLRVFAFARIVQVNITAGFIPYQGSFMGRVLSGASTVLSTMRIAACSPNLKALRPVTPRDQLRGTVSKLSFSQLSVLVLARKGMPE
jgi:hypothetical protein